MPDEKKAEQKKYMVSLPADPRQRDIEQFQAARRKFGPVSETRKYGVEYNGEFVRAAAELGWIEGLKPDDVGDMRAGAVLQLANPISEWISEAIDLPGE
jgi:hypothetical protein